MKYGWQIGDIENKLSNLPDKCSSTEYENSVRNVYEELIRDYYNTDIEDTFAGKGEFVKALKEFNFRNVNGKYLDLAIYLGSALQNVSFELPTPEVEDYSLDKIIDIAKIYMRRTEKGSNYNFKRVISNPKRIHILFNQSVFNAWGKSYIINREEFYILIRGINGIQDTVTFLHESSHIEDYLKSNGQIPTVYYELASLTREHYAFDFMNIYEQKEDVEKNRVTSLYHYVVRAIRLYKTIYLISDITKNQKHLDAIVEDYDKFASNMNVGYITRLLNSNLEDELSYIVSFIASLDIYLNCLKEEAPIFVSMYHAGIRDINMKVIDRIVPYIIQTLFNNSKAKSVEKV